MTCESHPEVVYSSGSSRRGITLHYRGGLRPPTLNWDSLFLYGEQLTLVLKYYFDFLYGPRFLPVELCISSLERGTARIEGLSLLAKRIRLRV